VFNDPGIVDHEPDVDEELEEHVEEDLVDEMVWQDNEFMEGGDEESGSFVADEVIEPDLDVQPEVAIPVAIPVTIPATPATLPLQTPPPRWADDTSMDSDGDGLGIPRPTSSMGRLQRLRNRFASTRHEPHALPFAERRRLFNGGT